MNKIKWYPVETVFVDGELFGTRTFDYAKMRCFTTAYPFEEPHNTCKKEFDDRIEIHTDFFESEELAKAFVAGEITYIHHYDSYYGDTKPEARFRFAKREIVKVDIENGIHPHRGIYKK